MMSLLKHAKREGWFLGLLLIAIALRTYHFDHPVEDGHSFRQAQTLMYAASYGHGASWLAPFGNWFGTRSEPAVLEFPVYSILAYLGGKLVGLLLAARTVSMIGSLCALFIFDRILAIQGHPRRRTAVVLMALSPIAIFYGHATQPDGLMVLLLLAAAYASLREGTHWLVVSIATFALAGMIKPTALVVLAFPLVLHGSSENKLTRNIAILLAASIATAAWAAYVRELLVHSNPVWYAANADPLWLFGRLQTRLASAFYGTFIERLGMILLPPLTVGLLFRAGWNGQGREWWWSWLLGGATSVLIFANLEVIHYYYQLPLVPGLAALAAMGAPSWPARALWKGVGAGGLLIIVVVAWRGLVFEQPVYHDAGAALASAVRSDPRPPLVMTNYAEPWGDMQTLFFADRDGYYLRFDSSADEIAALPSPGPCHLVLIPPEGHDLHLPRGWSVVRRGLGYAVGRRVAAGC